MGSGEDGSMGRGEEGGAVKAPYPLARRSTTRRAYCGYKLAS